MNIHTRKRAIFMRSVDRRNDSFGADTEGFALSSQCKLSVLLVVGIVILSAKECEMDMMGKGGDKPVTFAYICTNGTKAEGTTGTEGTEKCSACETGFALSLANECATDSDSDGTADSVDAFPFDDERTAGLCGELSPSVVPESGADDTAKMTKRAANDATGEVYMGEDERLIASGTGHRDDPFIIPLSDGCRSINFVWDFTGLTIPDTVTDETLAITGFADIDYHFVRFTNLPAASTIYAQTTLTGAGATGSDFGIIYDVVINGEAANSLRFAVTFTAGTMLPIGAKGQEHALIQNFLDMSYVTGLSSASISRDANGRIRFRVLIEPSE